MKMIARLLMIIMMLVSVQPCFAEDDPVVATYTAAFSPKQGENSWYFMKFGNDITELEWNNAGYWGTSPYLCGWEVNPGDDGSGVGYKFVAPLGGTVRLRGKVEQTNPDAGNGDGVSASIYKGTTKLWECDLIRYGIAVGEYDVTVSVRKGEPLYFRVDPRANNYWDFTVWFPTVEYTGGAFSGEEKNTYFQKKDGVMTELQYNEEKEGYVAEDGQAFISGYNVMPSDEYSVVRKYNVTEDGRYRIKAVMRSDDIRSNGNVIKVYKNGEEIWKQLFVDDEDGTMDIRVFALKDDIIDVEVCKNEFGGYNYCDWELSISKFVGTLPCTATVAAGRSSSIEEEITLGSLVGAMQGQNGMQYYSVKNDEVFPMVYDNTEGRWKQDLSSSRYTQSWLVYMSQEGYISKTHIAPGQHTQSVMETTISKDGILNIAGTFGIKGLSDGVVIDIYHNDKLLWSSRTGGARSVRWDEAYDTSYFNYTADVVAPVCTGDKLSFKFEMWRTPGDDDVDISDIKLRYIGGNVLSDTTKWKMDNSIIIDTAKSCAYVNGVYEKIDSYVQDGTTYIAKADAERIFNVSADGNYVSVRAIAEANGKNVIWTADRLAIIYEGIPVMYGFSDVSEIETAIKVGELYE